MSVRELPRIMIVTPNFNQAPFLEDALRSVLDQEYPRFRTFCSPRRSGGCGWPNHMMVVLRKE
jgi:cellulose synthase/poly-beta-1,6-N-acetylglucosamine synthase-like glycosyltransferase